VALLRWVDNREADAFARVETNRAKISAEIADVMISLLLFVDRVGLDLATVCVEARSKPPKLSCRQYSRKRGASSKGLVTSDPSDKLRLSVRVTSPTPTTIGTRFWLAIGLDEVNFWQPSAGAPVFGQSNQASHSFFRLKSPHHAIAGSAGSLDMSNQSGRRWLGRFWHQERSRDSGGDAGSHREVSESGGSNDCEGSRSGLSHDLAASLLQP